MKTVHIGRTYDGSGTNNWTMWKVMVEDVVLPIFQGFNNLTYVGMSTVSNNGEYVFSINDSNDYYLRISIGSNSYPSLVLLLSSSGSLTANGSNIGRDQVTGPQSRISFVKTQGINTRAYIDFWMYYITDDDDNLKVFWMPNPTFGGMDASYPKCFVKTAKNRDAIVDFASGDNALNLFYLDDDSHTNYFLAQDTTMYTSDSDVLKSTYNPIRVDRTITSGCTDAITEDFVKIFNSKLNSVWYSGGAFNNGGPNVRRLIRIGSTYYRQLVANWWIKDPMGDEPIVEYLDPQT